MPPSEFESSSTTTTKRLVPAIERAVAILDRLADESRPVGPSQLARELGLPKSSVHGICETLRALAVLRSNGQGYELGQHVVKWGSAFLQRSDLVTEFQRLVSCEQRVADYTVTLSTLQGTQVVYLACKNSNKPLGFTFQAGMQLPAVYTATGKAMLTRLAPSQRQALLSQSWPKPYTKRSVTNRQAFERERARWDTLGYAIDDGQVREGMCCVGAAILNQANQPVAGLAISMTGEEAQPALIEELGQLVSELAHTMTLA